VWRCTGERWRLGENTREVEKKKEVALLLEERRNKNIFFSLIEEVGIGYKLF
jgi:hypothetical protein